MCRPAGRCIPPPHLLFAMSHAVGDRRLQELACCLVDRRVPKTANGDKNGYTRKILRTGITLFGRSWDSGSCGLTTRGGSSPPFRTSDFRVYPTSYKHLPARSARCRTPQSSSHSGYKMVTVVTHRIYGDTQRIEWPLGTPARPVIVDSLDPLTN